MSKQQNLPVVPIKNTVLFPNLLMPLSVGRPQSVAAIQAALASEEKEILVVTQRDSSVEVPGPADLFPTATKAVIKRSRRSGDKYDILVLGVERVALVDFTGEDFLRASFRPGVTAGCGVSRSRLGGENDETQFIDLDAVFSRGGIRRRTYERGGLQHRRIAGPGESLIAATAGQCGHPSPDCEEVRKRRCRRRHLNARAGPGASGNGSVESS